MLKRLLPALFCLAAASASATELGTSSNERMLNQHGGKTKSVNRDQLKRDLDETMLIIEDLCRQAKLATKEEIEDVWASGKRDFKLSAGEIKDARKAYEKTAEALALEAAHSREGKAKALKLREDARDAMRSHHKNQPEEYIRDLRNWLNISEGTLRRANDKREQKK